MDCQLSRGVIARFIAENPGQGTIWIDHGDSGRLLSAPIERWQGERFEDLAHQPLPGEVTHDEQWAGWLSYDLAATEVSARVLRLPAALPSMGLRRYAGALVLHADGTYEVRGEIEWLSALARCAQADPESLVWAYGSLETQWTRNRYDEAFRTIKKHLVQGDTYQINLSHLFVAPAHEPASGPKALAQAAYSFAVLAEQSPAPYGAFVDVDGERAILSNSPELLFSLVPRDGQWEICTGPIKGTRPRGTSTAEDQALAQALLDSEKDGAEHLMIVDLLRNDLVRVAQAASVRAPATPSLLTLPTVHHLETKIRARLHPECGMLHLWRALAPGGSVTGAPKRSSIEIIDALERQARGVYCGSIFVGDAKGCTANIAIRTAEARDGALFLRSGGGIVLDSESQAEWDETLDKTRAFAAPSLQKRREP